MSSVARQAIDVDHLNSFLCVVTTTILSSCMLLTTASLNTKLSKQ